MTATARRRFVFTLGMNLLRTGISFATGMLAARWLGPASYGDMMFLLGTFVALRALLDMGTAAAFFTFSAQQPRSRQFVRRFFFWLGLQCVVPLVVIGLLLPVAWTDRIWHGASVPLVLLAFAAAFWQGSVWPVVQQLCESQRRTYLAQGIGVAVTVGHLLALGCFWWLGILGVRALLIAVAIEYAIAAIVAWNLLALPATDGDEPLAAFVRRFATYCLPLVPFAAASFGSEFVDRWMLQQYGGGTQQAYYAVGAQLSSIALLATTSVLNIFWKEIAEAHHLRDFARTAALYRRVSRLLFFVGATVAGFLMPWSAELLHFILGPAYVGGASALMIMLLYPVHQAIGQVGATMMYATERVGAQVKIGIVVMAIGMLTTYFVLAPRTNAVPGLGWGSLGLTVKMVGVQIIGVNALAFAISRLNKWRFDWHYQPIALAVCLGHGWLVHWLCAELLPHTWALPLRVIPAGVLHCSGLAAVLYAAPSLIGFSHAELRRDMQRTRAMIWQWRAP